MDVLDHLEAFRRYQTVRGLSVKTIRRRAVSLHQFTQRIAPLPLLRATGPLIEDWLETLECRATRRAYRSDLMAFYTWATKRDMCVNPVLKTDSIRVPKPLPRPVAPSYLPAILAAATPDVRLMVALAAFAGLRCAEIAALDRSDIDMVSECPTLAVRAGKGNKDRVVPLHPQLIALLRESPRAGRVVSVSATRVGQKISVHLRSLGVEATAHKLRHSFGSELARAADGNVVLVATLMGHADVSTSMRYIGWAGGPAAAAIAAMYPPTAA